MRPVPFPSIASIAEQRRTKGRSVTGKAPPRFQCPKHKSKYQPDGEFISGRATRGMDRFSIRRAGETVVVDLAVLHKQDTDAAGWNAALVTL